MVQSNLFLIAKNLLNAMVPLLVDGSGNLKTSNIGAAEYETVAASQTNQVLGTTGAVGDFLKEIIIVPATSAAGIVTLLDGATSIPIFVGGGTTALSDLKPIVVQVGAKSVGVGWKVTTGANVSVIGIGDFT